MHRSYLWQCHHWRHMAPVGAVIESFRVRYQQYADDTAVFLYENQTQHIISTYYVHARRRCITGISQTIYFWTSTSPTWHCWNCQPTATGSLSQFGWSSWSDTASCVSCVNSEFTWRHSGPAAHTRWSCNCCSQVLQLPLGWSSTFAISCLSLWLGC